MIDFVGPISPLAYKWGAWYLITSVDYLTIWVKAIAAKYCIAQKATKFIYENIITRLGFPKEIVSDQGKYFVNHAIKELLTKFII